MQLGLFLLSLYSELFFDFFAALLLVDLIAARNFSLIVIVKLVHCVRVGVQNFDVVDIVVAEGFLNLVQKIETFLKLLIQLNVVNGLLHLCDFNVKLVFLLLN